MGTVPDFHPAWLGGAALPAMQPPRSPAEAAQRELSAWFAGRSCRASLRVDPGMGEAYAITASPEGYTVTGGESGALYGAFALILALNAGAPVPSGRQSPACGLRMLNCWDNMSGAIERGYAGRSLWFEAGAFSYDAARVSALGRMLASVGVNVLCLNNVNVGEPAQELIGGLLNELAAFAAVLRPWAVRLMVAVDFSMPLRDGLDTADPLDPRVAAWWKDRTRRVYEAVPDLAGFLVKADSEHRPGPHTYGRTHAEGANMLAGALRPHGGTLVWRAFVYNCRQDWRDATTDRPRAAFDLYHPLDGSFAENVILQVKYGPYDFQPREPVSPLFFGMPRTSLALELQLAQEYTGQQVDIFAMPPMWREIIDTMGPQSFQAMAAVSNLGRDACWTGHPFAQLNLFAFGRFAWNPQADPEAVTREWVRLTYPAFSPSQADTLTRLLMDSSAVYERYTAPLGLCWMVSPDHHYGPSPYGYEFQAWGTYNRADRNAVGIDRTVAGTGYVLQYPDPLRDLYARPETCPDELLLFFHRLPYGFRMRDGRTLIQRIYDDHFAGCAQAEAMGAALETLPFPEGDREIIRQRMARQIRNAREWRDVVNTFFHRFSGIPDEKGRKIYP